MVYSERKKQGDAHMSDDDRNCPECGGTNGSHYSDCDYDGTDDSGGNYSFKHKRNSNVSAGKVWIFFIIAIIIGYAVNEIIGVVLLIGTVIYACAHK